MNTALKATLLQKYCNKRTSQHAKVSFVSTPRSQSPFYMYIVIVIFSIDLGRAFGGWRLTTRPSPVCSIREDEIRHGKAHFFQNLRPFVDRELRALLQPVGGQLRPVLVGGHAVQIGGASEQSGQGTVDEGPRRHSNCR